MEYLGAYGLETFSEGKTKSRSSLAPALWHA